MHTLEVTQWYANDRIGSRKKVTDRILKRFLDRNTIVREMLRREEPKDDLVYSSMPRSISVEII